MANNISSGGRKTSQTATFTPLDFIEFVFYVDIPIIFVPMGILVNILILYAFSTRRLNVARQHRYYYIVTAIGDILAVIGRYLLLSFLGNGLYALSGYSIQYYFSTFSLFHCLFSYNMWAVGEMVSNYTMSVFCIERFLSVSFPLHAKSWITFKRAVISHCMLLLPLTVYEVFHMVMTHTLIKSSSTAVGFKCGTDSTLPYIVTFTWINNFVLKYGHMVTSFIFNILLIINIRRGNFARQKLMSNASAISAKSEQVSRSEIGTTIIILLASFVTIVVWVPHSVFGQMNYILGNMAIDDPAIKSSSLYNFIQEWYSLSYTGLLFSHVTNFWILAFRMRAFRNLILCHSVTYFSRQSTSQNPKY